MDTVRLKPIDIAIIRQLELDSRSSVTKIATKLGVAESTVRHRMKRLVKEGILEFTAVTNPLKLGYQLWTIIEVQAEITKVEKVAERLSALPEIYFVGITTGSYDLVAWAVFHSTDELFDFLTRRISTIPGIVRTFTSNMLKLVKRKMPLGRDDGSSLTIARAGRRGVRSRDRGRAPTRSSTRQRQQAPPPAPNGRGRPPADRPATSRR